MPRFPYTRIVHATHKSFRKFKNLPLLKVGILTNSKLMVKPLAFIDTGAQFCLFDNAYAKPLGIKDYKDVRPEDIIPLSGIGGKRPQNKGYFHDLKLVIFEDQKRLKLNNVLRIIETKIGFLEEPIGGAGILGVYGFLDHFVFTANIPEGYFEIEPLF